MDPRWLSASPTRSANLRIHHPHPPLLALCTMPDYDDLPRPQDASSDEPVTDSKEKQPPTPQGRADDDTDVRDDDGDTDIAA